MPLRINSFLLCICLAIIYYGAAQLGFLLAVEQANTSPVWPPTGIAIAAMLYFGSRAWPGILIGSFAADYATLLPWTAASGIAIGNTLEAVVACYIIVRFSDRYPFRTVPNVFVFLSALTLSTAMSATLGVALLIYSGQALGAQFGSLWLTWWMGNLTSGLVIVPLLLTWIRPSGWQFRQLPELFALVATLLVFSAIAFSDLLGSGNNYPLAFIFLPIIIWGALRYGLHGVTALIVLLSLVAIYGTTHGLGPFVRDSANESLILLQTFIATVVLANLILAASRNEWVRADSQLKNSQEELEQRVEERTAALARMNTELQDEVTQRERTTDALKTLVTATSLSSHDEFLRVSVKSLAAIYNTRYAFYGVFSDDTCTEMKTLAVWANDNFADNFQYPLRDTPCQDVLNSNIELIPDRAARLYPDDQLLQDMSIKSYFGAPLLAPDDTLLGIVVVMDTEPMQLQEWVKPILGILANRIALELRRKVADEEIKLAENVFNESVEAIMISDGGGRILRVNPAFSDITGYSSADALGQSADLINSDQHAEQFPPGFWEAFHSEGHWQGEIWLQSKNGSAFPVWQMVSRVLDDSGELHQVINVFSDISDKKKTEQQIYQLAHYDTLTGLPNRASFQNQLEQALLLSARHGYKLALIFFDIDNFKLINDTSGHQAGDELLRQVARRLNSIVRKEDTVSRLGGDEFTVLINDIHSSEDVVVVAEKILADLAAPMELEHGQVYITVSIGISTFPNDGADADTLLKHADAAMYRAKDQGKNNFQFFTSEMHTQAIERLELEKAMRKAIENNEFSLHYQPLVDTFSGEINSCEVLIRWQHPVRGIIAPDKFIPIAEENGLIVVIGEWVMRTACEQYRQWSQAGIAPKRLAVNISGRQLVGHNLVAVIRSALEDSGISPDHIELEITESMLMANIDETIETLSELRAMGIYLSIDDFGTGYSSMAYLKRFPINKLKIDRVFINDIATDSDDAAIVSATIAMGHNLKLTVTAEGVETEEQLQFLQEQGCDEVQGFYFGRPLPGEDTTRLLAAGPIRPEGLQT